MVVLGKMSKMGVFGQLKWQNGCIWSKLVVFRQKWLYLGKFNGCIWHNSIHEKLLDSNWLRALQLKSNTSAKSVTRVQITNQNS